VRGSFQLGIAILSLLAGACGQSSKSNDAVNPATGAGASGGDTASGGSGGSGAGASGRGGDAGSGTTTGGSGGSGESGAGGTVTGGTGGAPNGSINLEGNPFYTRVQRLTNSQWEHAVTDILRLSAPGDLGKDLVPPLFGAAEFSNNEKFLYVDQQSAAAFELAAEGAAALATGTPEALDALDAGTDGPAFVRAFGRRAFRRPLTDAEVTKYEEAFALGESFYGAGFANGASFVIRAMLQSPHFLYRSELGPAGEPLTSHEIASKLSFWLLGTTPSDALLDAADADALATVDQLEAVARDMLEDAAARSVMRDFHGQVHHMSRYRRVDTSRVTEFPPVSGAELEEVSLRFFDGVFTRGEGLGSVFTSTTGFVGPSLAALYGIDPAPTDIEERDLGSSRSGYFLQVPFLILYGQGRQPSTVHRGLALISDVLCATLPPPDGDVIPIPPQDPTLTNRELITQATADCGDCHKVYINPLGFAFEGMDGMGQERTMDNGKPIDATGSYPFSEGTKDFSDARDLMNLFVGSEQVHTCYAKKVTGYALQRDIVETDRAVLAGLAAVSQEESIKETLVALVKDPAFRLREEGTP
jgi:hypothetical protein